MVDLIYCLTNLLLLDIPLLYYVNLNSSIICCLFSGDIYLSFGISNSSSFCECNSLEDLFETLGILSAILLPINMTRCFCCFFKLLLMKQFLLHLL